MPIIHSFFIVICVVFSIVLATENETIMQGGETFVKEKKLSNQLDIYCHKAEDASILHTFKSLYLNLLIKSVKYELFDGINASMVREQYKEQSSNWFNIFPWKHTALKIPLYKDYCIGISTKEEYKIDFNVRKINFWMLMQMCLGLVLFLIAYELSRNVIFYYSTGMTVGILASLLILVFVVSKFMPMKKGAYVVLFFGWSMIIYSFQLIYGNLQTVLHKYGIYLVAYVVIAALVSFAVCYKYGPVGDIKTQNLIKWFLQIIAVLLILCSSENKEASTSIAILLITFYNFPKKWTVTLQMKWHRVFPPKVKLLTEEEYLNQASEETKKALDDLRGFCHSPKCNAWKTVGRLKSPLRFAEFIEGSSHLTDQEMMSYDADSLVLGNNDSSSGDSMVEQF